VREGIPNVDAVENPEGGKDRDLLIDCIDVPFGQDKYPLLRGRKAYSHTEKKSQFTFPAKG
jgi:hypothetical protein